MKFTLEIELGNDAMNDYNAVGSALAGVSRELMKAHAQGLGCTTVDSGRIRDLNGNTAGKWEVTE